jgi:hypothetical protein
VLGVWTFTLVLLTCLGIDFSNPLLPGVVRFGEEESVRALRAERSRIDERPARAVPLPPEPVRGTDVAVAAPHHAPGSTDGPRPLLRAERPRASIDAARGGPSAPEDH